MEFQSAYEEFIREILKERRGPSMERLKEGIGYAERLFLQNVWWPSFHHFEGLEPEYEITDFKDGSRFIDFAYIHPYFRIAIEVDGLGIHWQNISQEQFSDHLQRQNHLVIDGWYILRFSFLDLQKRPRLCQQTIQQLVGRLTGDASAALKTLRLVDREILRLAMVSQRPITTNDVARHLHVRTETATSHLKNLTIQGWLEPASGSIRIRSYRIHPSRTNIHL